MRELPGNAVITKDGVRGTLVDGMPTNTTTSHVLVAFETGQRVLIPVDALTLQADSRYYYLALRLDQLEQQRDASIQPAEQQHVLPVIAEVVEVERRQMEIGRVRVHKQVHERTEVVDEPLRHDEIIVTRVAVNRVIDQPIEVRQEGETLIVPVLEEVLVVEKRLLLVEEVHIRRQTTETHQPQEVTLRREDVVVQRIAPNEQADSAGADSPA